MTCGPFGISISGGAEFRSRPTNLAKPDKEVVYLLVKLAGQPRLQVESAYYPTDEPVREKGQGDR